jgi:hypothetical protein
VAALASLLPSREAGATGVAIDLIGGYGVDDAYRMGLGARGGVTLPQNLYFGGTFVLHRGRTGVRTEQTTIPQATPMYFGPEGGYDFQISEVTIRPYVGAGCAVILSTGESCSATSCTRDTSSTDVAVTLWPGVAVTWSTGGLSLGADFRYLAVVGSAYENALAGFATAGLRF